MVRGSVILRLTAAEIEEAARVARARNENKQRAGIGRRGTYDGMDDPLTMHTLAARAELAVCRITGAAWDTSISARGNPEGNIILPTGLRAHARFRSRRGWDFALKSNQLRHFPGAVGFLVWPAATVSPSPSELEIVGWISKAEFAALATETAYRRGEGRLHVPVAALHHMTERVSAGYEPAAEQGGLFS